jgi:UDP-N-acetylmuramate--alanine ligase
MDADHLDIYGTAESVEQGFIDFSKKIKPGGLLVSKFGLKRSKELKGDKHVTYSVREIQADVYASDVKVVNGGYAFNVVMKEGRLEDVRLNMGGMHNIENAVAAIAATSSLEIEKEKLKGAIASFKGVKRRFEYIIPPLADKDKIVFIDDYAHHPEELRALITGARSLFANKKCTVIFQPHLYSRTRDHADGFAEVLDMADEVILLPIYPARELPIEGVSSEMILKKMKSPAKRVIPKEELTKWVRNEYVKDSESGKRSVLITAGAGDIDTLVEPIKKILEEK